jgi:GntR family transcriptional regulator
MYSRYAAAESTEPELPMRIVISNASPDPIYEQILQQIRAQILSGELSEGDQLPSIRKLARDLQISVITTKRSYEELEREGFINTVGGKGTFVAAQNPEFLREKRMKAVEERLAEAVDQARLLNVGSDELAEMLRLLYAEDE